jgi:exodeoxyribonuclease X
MIIRPCDTETTGKEPTDEVIEIGWHEIRDGHLYTTGRRTFVKPARPIPASASAVHHITDADVADAPPWNEAWRIMVDLKDDGAELKFAAHVASFERQYLDPVIKADWICTWKCALRKWPHLESHALQALRYALDLPADPMLAMPPHRALPDAYVCGLLVLELLKTETVETLVAWSEEPPVFTKFDFGKFKGQPLSAADDSWIDWYLNKATETNPDWRWNLAAEVVSRKNARTEAYLDRLLPGIAAAATVLDLENWYHGQAAHLPDHGIFLDTPKYKAIIAACAARKAELVKAGGAPDFGAAP